MHGGRIHARHFMSLIVDEHRQYLSDANRLDAFSRAIDAAVRPGSIVLDLASGTGILGLMACRAGAARVYSVEVGGMIEAARGIAGENGFADRIVFIKGLSTHIQLPERVDVVVADQIGNFGFNAGIVEYFADARLRFLKPEGVTLPRQLDLRLCLVESEARDAQVEFWRSRPSDFGFESLHELAANTGYQVDLAPSETLSDPQTLARVCLGGAVAPIRGTVSLQARRSGVLHGLGGWFSAELAPGISMTNDPFSASRIRRRQIFFPVRPALRVEPSDQVDVAMTILPKDGMVSWSVEVQAKDGSRRKSARHSTWKGMLLDREDLERTRPDFVPTLTERGEARRSVVNLCDGSRCVRAIEEEVRARHPDLFSSRADAEEFVAEVITRYAR